MVISRVPKYSCLYNPYTVSSNSATARGDLEGNSEMERMDRGLPLNGKVVEWMENLSDDHYQAA
jgi:hypothetical protein